MGLGIFYIRGIRIDQENQMTTKWYPGNYKSLFTRTVIIEPFHQAMSYCRVQWPVDPYIFLLCSGTTGIIKITLEIKRSKAEPMILS